MCAHQYCFQKFIGKMDFAQPLEGTKLTVVNVMKLWFLLQSPYIYIYVCIYIRQSIQKMQFCHILYLSPAAVRGEQE